jgi:hypothetical protein
MAKNKMSGKVSLPDIHIATLLFKDSRYIGFSRKVTVVSPLPN